MVFLNSPQNNTTGEENGYHPNNNISQSSEDGDSRNSFDENQSHHNKHNHNHNNNGSSSNGHHHTHNSHNGNGNIFGLDEYYSSSLSGEEIVQEGEDDAENNEEEGMVRSSP